MAETRVALVSGGNRGIGLEIVRQLSRRGVLVGLGARDKQAGLAAAEGLKPEGLEPAVVELDVGSSTSVASAAQETKRLFGRLDILVNNAGILIDKTAADADETSVLNVPLEAAIETFNINTAGAMRLTQSCVPIMQENRYGRIVNMSSGMGQLDEMGGGFPAYRMSKTALNALTKLSAADLADHGIKVNAMCPGWVRTDMGGPDASRSVEEGAETAVWLATLEDDGPTGGFFRDMKSIAW